MSNRVKAISGILLLLVATIICYFVFAPFDVELKISQWDRAGCPILFEVKSSGILEVSIYDVVPSETPYTSPFLNQEEDRIEKIYVTEQVTLCPFEKWKIKRLIEALLKCEESNGPLLISTHMNRTEIDALVDGKLFRGIYATPQQLQQMNYHKTYYHPQLVDLLDALVRRIGK